MTKIMTIVLLLLAAAAQAQVAGDAQEGERLYATNCTGCHDTGVHARKDHRVKSLAELRKQLQSCAHMTQKSFSPEQMDDLVKYLNDRFYHFP